MTQGKGIAGEDMPGVAWEDRDLELNEQSNGATPAFVKEIVPDTL